MGKSYKTPVGTCKNCFYRTYNKVSRFRELYYCTANDRAVKKDHVCNAWMEI